MTQTEVPGTQSCRAMAHPLCRKVELPRASRTDQQSDTQAHSLSPPHSLWVCATELSTKQSNVQKLHISCVSHLFTLSPSQTGVVMSSVSFSLTI